MVGRWPGRDEPAAGRRDDEFRSLMAVAFSLRPSRRMLFSSPDDKVKHD